MRNNSTSLSSILALRMVAVSAIASLLMAGAFFLHYLSDTPQLREATLRASVFAIANALNHGEDPRQLVQYRDYPASYGFRVFDRRSLASRHILVAANTRWLPAMQHLQSAQTNPGAVVNRGGLASDLFEDFERSRPPHAELPVDHVVSLLIHRISLSGHKYWIQAYMIGDPAWVGLPVILNKLASHVLFPVIFLVPALTLALFLATRSALRPLRQLSREAARIGPEVASGQPPVPLSQQGMAKEFAEVVAAMNAMLAKLERSLQLQKQFTSDAAHELRTPLAVLLLEVSQLSPGPARNRIKTDLQELGDLVNELLRFAQAEDQLAHEMSTVDVVAVAQKVCEEVAVKAVARNLMIEFDHVERYVAVMGNATLIEMAIRNLIDNALKYSPPDASVIVKIEPGPIVLVEDDGPGIPPEQLTHVFERFWRADQVSGSGAGIGLALVRRIAQLHNASIGLENRPSGGTRAILSFAQNQTPATLFDGIVPRYDCRDSDRRGIA